MPAQKELEKNKAERDRLESEFRTANTKYGDITSTEAQVAKLLTSVDDFETRFLPVGTIGKSALYQRINGLIGAYGLVNTTGPDYAPLQIADNRRGQETESERGRAKFQSLFPGVYVTMTVEGSYQNLRRFIREMETGNQFVVISAVELEPAETENKENNGDQSQPGVAKQQINNVRITPNTPNTIDGFTQNQRAGQPRVQYPGQPSAPYQTTTTTTAAPKAVRGKTHGETVSLRLEMAAYFRRPVVQQTEVGNQ
jgi:Tfp pilus assembly protein PilO